MNIFPFLFLILLLLLSPACREVEEFFNDLEQVNDALVDVIDPTDSISSSSTTTTTTSIDPSNPICASVYGTDGPGGFLWKPVSESNGNVAVQLPGKFATRFSTCVIVSSISTEYLVFSGFHNWDGQDIYRRERQLWRGSKPGHYYPNGSKVVCKESKQECEWYIVNTSIRND